MCGSFEPVLTSLKIFMFPVKYQILHQLAAGPPVIERGVALEPALRRRQPRHRAESQERQMGLREAHQWRCQRVLSQWLLPGHYLYHSKLNYF